MPIDTMRSINTYLPIRLGRRPYKIFVTSKERKFNRRQRREESRKRKRGERIAKYDDFSLIYNIDNLYKAFHKCKLGVLWKESTQRYRLNLFSNLLKTSRQLINGENVTCGFVEFIINERGKKRHIRSVHISERVIQKCLCDQSLVPILSNSLIYDNGASLKNKGIHFSIRRFIHHLSHFYRHNGFSNNGYCLSVDFSKYFDSIAHSKLIDLVERVIHDQQVVNLIKQFVFSFGADKSLGLGSQVSQILAIFYLNKMDHFIKEVLRIKYYGRYMDDIYLIHHDKQYLEYCRKEIQNIHENLGIRANDKKTRITKLKDGIKFLKGVYFLTEKGRVVRYATPDSRKRMRRKLVKFKALLEAGKMSYGDIRTAYQSWRGNYIKRFDAYNTIRRMDGLYNRLFVL